MFVRISIFLALLSAAFLLVACGPEAVPIVATYEPVDCTCPEPVAKSEPAEPLTPPANRPAGTGESDGGEDQHESDEEPVASSADKKTKASDRGETPTEAREREPPPALDPRVDLNTASAAELRTLPRIGPAKAERILEYRARRPFRRSKDLMRIKGIGPATYKQLKEKIVVREVTEEVSPKK